MKGDHGHAQLLLAGDQRDAEHRMDPVVHERSGIDDRQIKYIRNGKRVTCLQNGGCQVLFSGLRFKIGNHPVFRSESQRVI